MPPPVATQVAGQMLRYAKSAATLGEALRKVELNSTFRNGFCNLSRYVFGRCKVTLEQCFVQFVRVSRQVARRIAQCNSAFSLSLLSRLFLLMQRDGIAIKNQNKQTSKLTD